MSHPSIIKTAIPCSCTGTCGVVVILDFEEYGEQPREIFAEFYTSYRSMLRHRLRAAWGVLRGADPAFHCVCLDAEGVQMLREALDGRAARTAVSKAAA